MIIADGTMATFYDSGASAICPACDKTCEFDLCVGDREGCLLRFICDCGVAFMTIGYRHHVEAGDEARIKEALFGAAKEYEAIKETVDDV